MYSARERGPDRLPGDFCGLQYVVRDIAKIWKFSLVA